MIAKVLDTAMVSFEFLALVALLTALVFLAVPVFREAFQGDSWADSIEDWEEEREALRPPSKS